MMMGEIWDKMYYFPINFLFDCFSGLKDMSQKADFESDYTLLHTCYMNKKVPKKGIL